MTRKWLMSSLLSAKSQKKRDQVRVNIPEYIKKHNLDAEFVIDETERIDTKLKQVTGKQGTYQYDRLIIATGSVPKVPRVGIKGNGKMTTFDTFNDFTALRGNLQDARKVAVVGAGPIGFELALRLASRYKVYLIEYDDDLLMSILIDYPFYRKLVRGLLRFRGINLHLSTTACEFGTDGLACKTLRNEEFNVDCDVVAFAAGVRPRVPVIDGEEFGKDRTLCCCDFGTAFVHERGGKRRKLKDVYAVGDATCYLTKKNYPASAIFAKRSAKVAAYNAVNGNRRRIRYHPSVYYKAIDTVMRRVFR